MFWERCTLSWLPLISSAFFKKKITSCSVIALCGKVFYEILHMYKEDDGENANTAYLFT